VSDPLTVLVGIYSPFAAWNIPAAHVERLRREFPRHTVLHAGAPEQSLALVPRAHVAFMAEFDTAHLAAAGRLKWVHSPAAGVGGMLFPAMVQSPVLMTNSRGISANTIAEHVIAVTLVLFRKLPLAFRSQAAREWAQNAVLAAPPIRTIAGARALVIGLGSIGSASARLLTALGARVTGIRRRPGDHGAPGASSPERTDGGVEHVAGPEALLTLLPEADIVVIAAPQTRDTHGLIGQRELAAMRRDAVLVNVSRGKLVDEAALAQALTAPEATRTIGSAALDVFEHEPLPASSPLWALPNVVITPHMAGFRPDHWDAVTDLFADNLRRFETGAPLRNVVDKTHGY
jgi:phosphoglycerate dehydrogenase-like enzyme